MRILSAIISSIWNTVTFMDKEQRALVAHVLTVSQAHPKSFSYDNQHGTWQSKGLKIEFWQKGRTINLSNVTYQLGWRANAILAKHFAMLHICLHHEHIGKALSEIDKSENEPRKNANTYDNQQAVGDIEPQPSSSIITNLKRELEKRAAVKKIAAESIDMSKYIGKNCHVELSNGRVGNCFVDYVARFDAVFLFDGENGFNKFGHCGELSVVSIREVWEEEFSINLANFVGKEVVITRLDGSQSHAEVFLYGKGRYEVAGSIYFTNGKIWESGRPASANDITKIELVIPVKEEKPKWVTDIDLTKWIGKTVDVKLRNGVVIDAVDITAEPRAVVYIVRLGEIPCTKHGNYWHSQLDGRDVVAIRLST